MAEIFKIYKRGPWVTYDNQRVRVKVDPTAQLGIANTSLKTLHGEFEYEVTYNTKTGRILAVDLKNEKGQWVPAHGIFLNEDGPDGEFFELVT